MKTSISLLLISTAFFGDSDFAAAALPDVEVLQFDGVAPDGRGSPFLTGFFEEGGYRIYTPHGQWVDSMTEDVGTQHPDNGTDWFLNNNNTGIVITHAESLSFHLLSLDLAEYTFVSSGEAPIHIDAFTSNGEFLSTRFITAARPVGHVPIFQQFQLPAEWLNTRLRSVAITANNGFAVDNIRLMAVVPEPATLMLIAAACLARLLCRPTPQLCH